MQLNFECWNGVEWSRHWLDGALFSFDRDGRLDCPCICAGGRLLLRITHNNASSSGYVTERDCLYVCSRSCKQQLGALQSDLVVAVVHGGVGISSFGGGDISGADLSGFYSVGDKTAAVGFASRHVTMVLNGAIFGSTHSSMRPHCNMPLLCLLTRTTHDRRAVHCTALSALQCTGCAKHMMQTNHTRHCAEH